MTMPKPAPTALSPVAKFSLGTKEYSIEFNLEHLLKLEDAAGTPIMQLAQEQLDRLEVRDENGEPVEEPTPAQTSKAFMAVPLAKMRELVAVCMPMPVAEVPMVGLGKAYMQLATALSQAVGQLTGTREDDESEELVQQRPTEASGS